MIFKEWAIVSRKYNEHLPDPSRWKTNFRCALKSTKKFEELNSNNPDYHMYRIIAHNAAPAANLPDDRRNDGDHENDMLHISPSSEGVQGFDQTTPPLQQEINTAFEMLSLENPGPGLNVNTDENVYQCSNDTLQWVMQQANMNLDEIQTVSWAPSPSDHPIGEVAYQQNNTYAVSHVDQNGYNPLRNRAVNETVENGYYEEPSTWLPEITTDVARQSTATLAMQQAQQNSSAPNQLNHLADVLGNEICFIENMFMNEEPLGNGVMMCNAASQHHILEQNPCPLPVAPPVEQPPAQIVPLQNDSGTLPLNLGVSIFYRGSLFDELSVVAGSCLFTYNNNHTAQVQGNAQIIQFPNPERLPDQKQVRLTLTALQKAGLLLYHKNGKLWARRLGTCNVFWALSKQLENIAQHPEHRLLKREVDTEIFNFEHYIQGLQQLYDGQRSSSPDYTIYLCFGQRFSAAKPKESKLILVKLVPEVCKHLHERVLREGFSSLNSEIESLQFSNSLFDMMEYLTGICRPANEEH